MAESVCARGSKRNVDGFGSAGLGLCLVQVCVCAPVSARVLQLPVPAGWE